MQKLRGIAFEAFLYLSGIVLGIIALPFLLFGESAARFIAKLWVRMVLGALHYIGGVTHRIEGENNIPTDGALIAANHQSMWETIALYALMPRPVIIYKKELNHVPIYGWFIARAGNIAIDRQGGAKALRAMLDKAGERIREGCQVIVFPEGTRMQPQERAPYHPGIAGIYKAVNAPCTPAAHNSGQYWLYPGHKKKPGEITLRFLPAIEPGLDRKSFLSLVKEKIDAARPDLTGLENNGKTLNA